MYFFFSNVIDSAIYRSILCEFATEEYDLRCVFIGKESLPLFKYSQTLSIKSQHIVDASKFDIVKLTVFHILKLAFSKPKVVFCFGQTASIVGLTASFLSCKAKRYYLRCHTSMNKVERFPRGILYDKLCNLLAQFIIVPNKNTKNYLIEKENVGVKKLIEIKFGFHLAEFEWCDKQRIQFFQDSNNIPEGAFVIGIASRFTLIKGFQYSVPALTHFLRENPHAILVIAGYGEEIPGEMHELLSGISQSQIRLISRVNDMPAFYKSLSAFIHTPIDETVESFGLVYIEAFAAGTPSIITLSGIAKDVAMNKVNSLVVDFKDSVGILDALNILASNKDLSDAISLSARSTVSAFGMEKMCAEYVSLIREHHV
jgi:glycosyltransferase involved in cell wall biosynthesis